MNNKAARAVARLLVSLVLLSGTLWAESPRVCSVRGRVVNAAGDQPLRNARVQLKSTDDTLRFYDVTTDAGGQFAFTQVVPDTYRVVVRHNRFVPGVHGQKGAVFSSGSLLALKPGDEVNDLLFRLVPSAAISGQVVDEDGEPLPGVEVQALVQSSHAPAAPDAVIQNLVPIQTAITNDLGEFRLYSLPPGEYYISAVDSGMPAVNDPSLTEGLGYELADTPRPEYPPSYYPGAINLSQASKLVVRSGDEVQIEFGLRRGDMYAVSGRVLDASGHPLQGASIFVSPEELAAEFSSPRYGGETDSSGRFHITGVAPGNYSVQGWKVEGDKQRIDEHSISVSGGDITGLELVLLPPVKVSGRIAFEGSASLTSGHSMVLLSSIPEGRRRFSAGETTKDNTFVLENLLPGRYAISVTALAGDAYLKSAYLGTADVFKKGLRVGSIAPAGTLELVVSPFGASVEGTVTKMQKPAVGAYVRVEMSNAGEGRRSANTETETDQYGHFALHALPPGDYTLSVSEEQQSAGVHTIKVGLDEGQHRTVSVRLDSSE